MKRLQVQLKLLMLLIDAYNTNSITPLHSRNSLKKKHSYHPSPPPLTTKIPLPLPQPTNHVSVPFTEINSQYAYLWTISFIFTVI